VERLQSGPDEECVLFQKIAEQGHYAGRTKPSSTRQGTYVTTADGTLLISWNTNDPRVVASKLRQAIARWEKMQAERRPRTDQPRLDPAQLDRADRHFPEDGLVLRVSTRDLPRDPPQEERWASSWNQDFAWFKKEEARQFLPQTLRLDQSCQVPGALVGRLARLHFVDNVRGQTTPFPENTVQQAELTSRITAIVGDVVTIRLEGRTKTEEKGKWSVAGYRDIDQPSVQKRGMDLKLLGRARYDRARQKFVSFKLVAVGTRFGGTQYNVRARDLDPAHFGVLLTLVGDTKAERVAPEHFGAYGWR
jgi:hypothetical protein